MRFRRIALFAACAFVLAATPAGAMHWMIYAPDEASNRYWLDNDSIETKGDYIFVTYVLGAPDSLAPTNLKGRRIGINCSTGDSVFEVNGQTSPGPHFTDAAYLFKWLCPPK